jgi:hypothetical protein
MDLFQESKRPLWKQLRMARERMDVEVADGQHITATTTEGTIRDMLEIGQLQQVGDDMYEIMSAATRNQIIDDIRWWLDLMVWTDEQESI